MTAHGERAAGPLRQN